MTLLEAGGPATLGRRNQSSTILNIPTILSVRHTITKSKKGGLELADFLQTR